MQGGEGRGQGTSPLSGGVPEVCNLLRHLKKHKQEIYPQKVLHAQVATAVGGRGAHGESEKAVGSSRGGNYDVSGGTVSHLQPR